MAWIDGVLSPDDPWLGYVNTVVEIERPGVGDLTLRAAPAGAIGSWPWIGTAPLYVLTAWDPGEERLRDDENRTRQAALEAELGPRVEQMWKARGVDPTTGYRDEGMAVRGVAEAIVVETAARFGQEAIFVWHVREWVVASCGGPRRLSLGWSVDAASSHDLA